MSYSTQPGEPAPEGMSYIAASYIKFIEVGLITLPPIPSFPMFPPKTVCVHSQKRTCWISSPTYACQCVVASHLNCMTAGKKIMMFDMSVTVQMAGGRAVPIEYDLPQSEVKKRYIHRVKLNHERTKAKVCTTMQSRHELLSCAPCSAFPIYLMYKHCLGAPCTNMYV